MDQADTPGLARMLLETLAKLTTAKDKHDVLRSRYLHRAAAERLVTQVIAVVNDELDRALPSAMRNTIVDAIYDRLTGVNVENTPAEVKAISHKSVKS